MGTKKGMIRKTARRAYMPKKKVSDLDAFWSQVVTSSQYRGMSTAKRWTKEDLK